MKLVEVRQTFEAPSISDVSGAVRAELRSLISSADLRSGSRIGITAGSRGINDAVEVYRACVKVLKEAGHSPFLFAAMGSHGRGTAQGQRDLLRSLGVTEEKIGAPVSCSDEVVSLGETTGPRAGLPVYVAREAAEADAILAVNRVKPHTSFHGPHESGIMKMLAVGMGRARGAEMVHGLGWGAMVESVESIGGAALERLPLIGGLAMVENASERTSIIEGLRPEEIIDGEARLLDRAREYMSGLPVDDLDVLVVREMGKNYSGTGMDTNVIGRLRLEGLPEPEKPEIKYLAVLDLTGASHGNATGVGLADFVTERLAAKMDREATYLNCLTSGGPIRAAIPMTLPDDRSVIESIWKALKPADGSDVRLMVVDNTLHLSRLWVSESLVGELEERENIEIIGEPFELEFDGEGNIVFE